MFFLNGTEQWGCGWCGKLPGEDTEVWHHLTLAAWCGEAWGAPSECCTLGMGLPAHPVGYPVQIVSLQPPSANSHQSHKQLGREQNNLQDASFEVRSSWTQKHLTLLYSYICKIQKSLVGMFWWGREGKKETEEGRKRAWLRSDWAPFVPQHSNPTTKADEEATALGKS